MSVEELKKELRNDLDDLLDDNKLGVFKFLDK
jgi:hypothetical protein